MILKNNLYLFTVLLLAAGTSSGQVKKAPDRKECLNKFANYAEMYYRNSALAEHYNYIYTLPSFLSGLDSNELYTSSTLIAWVAKNCPQYLDTVARFVKGKYIETASKNGRMIDSRITLDFSIFDNHSTIPSWIGIGSKFFLRTIDSVIDINFTWAYQNQKLVFTDSAMHSLKQQAIKIKQGGWNFIQVSQKQLKDEFENFSPIANILFNTSCVFDEEVLNCQGRGYYQTINKIDTLMKLAENRYFKYDFTIDGLVSSPYYRRIFINDNVKILLSDALQMAKAILPANYASKVQHVKLDIKPDGQDKELLWFYNYKNTIFISPYFIRAVYINLITSEYYHHILDRYDKVHRTFSDRHQATDAEVKMSLDYFENAFRLNFIFILGHELAHIYLGSDITGDQCLDEEKCDCFSYTYTRSVSSFPGFKTQEKIFGSFNSILKRCYDEYASFYWGVDKVNDTASASRFKKLLALNESTVCPD